MKKLLLALLVTGLSFGIVNAASDFVLTTSGNYEDHTCIYHKDTNEVTCKGTLSDAIVTIPDVQVNCQPTTPGEGVIGTYENPNYNATGQRLMGGQSKLCTVYETATK